MALLAQAAIAEANAIAEEHLADRQNKYTMGYLKPGIFDFEKIEKMPPSITIYATTAEEKEKEDEEELLSPEEKEMLIAAVVRPLKMHFPLVENLNQGPIINVCD